MFLNAVIDNTGFTITSISLKESTGQTLFLTTVKPLYSEQPRGIKKCSL